MSIRFSLSLMLCFVALGVFSISGCGPTDSAVDATSASQEDDHDHDHEGHDHNHKGHDHGKYDDHDHDFESLSDAMAEVQELATEIGEAFTAGEPENAHDALHHIGSVLEVAEKMVNESDLEGEAKTAASEAVQTLFSSFGDLDKTLHSDEGKTYDEVKDSIASAIKTLSE